MGEGPSSAAAEFKNENVLMNIFFIDTEEAVTDTDTSILESTL